MSDFKPVNQPITPTSADPGEEFPFLHTITVVDRVVSVDKPELVQNNIKTETVTLNLDSEWDGLSCIINIGSGKTPTSLIWSGQPVVIPAELMTDIGTLNVSVVGYGDDGALRAVTKKADAMFTVVASGYVEGDDPVPDPTTILGQLTEAADRANQAADRFNQASEDIGDISNAVTEVKGYANAAKTSETNAASSATSASQSKATAASSASAAKVSETNAAASATAAQQATARTISNPDKFIDGTVDLNTIVNDGAYAFGQNVNVTNRPESIGEYVRGLLLHSNCSYKPGEDVAIQVWFNRAGDTGDPFSAMRIYAASSWSGWKKFAFAGDLSNYVSLSTYRALETRVKALETKLASQ